MTQESFLLALRLELLSRYSVPGRGLDSWACDDSKLGRFLAATAMTMAGTSNIVNIDSESFKSAWRAIGGKGKPTYKALRALPLQ